MTPRTRRASRLLGAVALATGIVLPAAAAAQGTQPAAFIAAWGLEGGGADGKVPTVHVSQGREATVPLVVGYDHDQVTSGPVTVTATLPAGVAFVRATALVPEAPGVTARWDCADDGPTVTCSLRTGDGTAPFPLDPAQSTKLLMTVRGADVPAVDAGADPVAVGNISAQVSVPQALDALHASTEVAVVASAREPVPVIEVTHVTHRPTAATGAASREGYDLHAHDIGAAPVRTVGRRPALVLTGVVPSVPLRDVTVDGAGWRCRPVSHFTCSYGATLPHGASAPALRVRWAARHDAKAIDAPWTIDGTAAYADVTGHPATLAFEVDSHLVLPETVVRLSASVRMPDGLHIVGGGVARQAHVRLTNIGTTLAPSAGVHVAVPPGVRVQAVTPGWRCVTAKQGARCMAPGQLQPRHEVSAVLALSAPRDVATEHGSVDVQPVVRVQPLGPGGDVRGEAHEVPVLVLDPGDAQVTPVLWFRGPAGWAEWRDGGAQTPSAGDAFTYRIELANTGGVAIPRGDHVSVRQAIGAAMGAVSATGVDAVAQCAVGGVQCTLTVGREVAPGGHVATIAVTTHPQRAGAQSALGPISTSVDGTKDHEVLRMNVDVVEPPDSLRPGMRVVRDPSAGGVGTLVMVVQNTGSRPVGDIHAAGAIPPGLVVDRAEAPAGWRCHTSTSRVACTFRGRLAAGARTPGVTVHVRSTGRAASSPVVKWSADGRSHDGELQRGRRRGVLPVRGPISATALATPRALPAMADGTGRRVALDASGSLSSGAALRYEWSQRCTTVADARAVPQCHGVATPVAQIDDPGVASTSALLPAVRARTAFMFQLRATDGSATRTALVPVVAAAPNRQAARAGHASGRSPGATARRNSVIARARAANGGRRSAARSAARNRRSRAAAAARRADIANRNAPHVGIVGSPGISAGQGDDVPLEARLSGRWGDGITYEWSQASGPTAELTAGSGPTAMVNAPDAEGPIVMRVTARDSAGHSDTGQIEVMVGASPSTQGGQVLLAAFRAARAGTVLPIDLGAGIVGTLHGLTGTRSGDSGSYAFSGSQVGVGALAIRNAAGVLTSTEITITGGSLVLPRAWGVAPIRVTPEAPLAVRFATAGADAALVGQARAPTSFAFFALPAGWAGNTTLTFAPGTWRVGANGTDGDAGTAAIEGTVLRDGTYDVTVTSEALLDIAGTPVALAGGASNRGGRVTSTVTGGVDGPIALGDGVSVEGLTAAWVPGARPTGTPAPGMTGAATLVIASGDVAPLRLDTRLAYESMLDWRLSLTGSGGEPWAPVPGLRIAPDVLSGYVGDADGTRQWAVEGNLSPRLASSLVSMSDLALSIDDACGADPALACPDTGLFLHMKGGVTLTSPATGAVGGRADAVLGLGEAGGFALASDLPGLDLGPGMHLGAPTLTVAYGMRADLLPDLPEAPVFADARDDELAVRVTGSLAVPALGTFDAVTARANARGWTVGGYDPDGIALGEGNGGQQGAWFGWASYDTSMQAPVPGEDAITAPITHDVVSVAGLYTAPAWFAALAGSAPQASPAVVSLDPASGAVHGDVAQRGSFDLPAGASQLTASGVVLAVRGDRAGTTVTAQAAGDLRVPGLGGGLVAVPGLHMALAGDAPTHSATATMSLAGGGDWADAFGVAGLMARAPTFAMSVDTRSRATQLRLMSGGTLPATLAGALHVPATGAPVSIAGDVAAPQACTRIQVGSTAGTQPVVSLGSGALTANYAEILIAPTGCALPSGGAALPSGLGIVFDGRVMGATVDVAVPVSLGDGLVMDDDVAIGDLLVGDLRLQGAHVGIHVNSATGRDDVSLSGGVGIFGTRVDVAGPLARSAAGTGGTLAGTAAGAVNVSGFNVRNLALEVPVNATATRSTAEVRPQADIDLMSDVLHVDRFEATLDNGVVEDVHFRVQREIMLHQRARVTGWFEMRHSASTNTATFDGQVTLRTAGGVEVGSAEHPAVMHIGAQCSSLTGPVAIPGVATAQVSGTIATTDACTTPVWDATGGTVQPVAGDYGLAADSVHVTLGGTWGYGRVGMGNIRGEPYLTLSTSVNMSPQDANSHVLLKGSYTADGHVDLHGAETLDVAGYTVPLQVAVTGPGDAPAFTGTGGVDVNGTHVDLSGPITYQSGVPSVQFTGTVTDLVLGGYHMGTSTVTLIDTPTDKGFTTHVTTSLGDERYSQVIAEGTVTFMKAGDGTTLFHGTLNGQLNLPAANAGFSREMDGVVDFTNCSSDCTAAAPASFTLTTNTGAGGASFRMKIAFSTDGSFSASETVTQGASFGPTDLFIVWARGSAEGRFTLSLSSNSPYASLATSASLVVEVEGRIATGGEWKTMRASAGLDVRLDPFRVCANLSIIGDICIP